jgi:hypothetical protein
VFLGQTRHGFQQAAHAFVTDARVGNGNGSETGRFLVL